MKEIKDKGVEKSGFASNISALTGKCASNTDAEAIAAMTTLKAIVEGAPEAECFNSECLSECFEQANSLEVLMLQLPERQPQLPYVETLHRLLSKVFYLLCLHISMLKRSGPVVLLRWTVLPILARQHQDSLMMCYLR